MNRLQELKIKASLLRKQLRSPEQQHQEKAAKRFLQLPFHQYSILEDVLKDVDFYQLKHAYWVLAIENNHETWQQYRDTIIKEDCMYIGNSSAFLNVWYANYEEAKQHQNAQGGYLLQYRKDYFICTEELIKELDLALFKKEWEEIGYDWAQPKSKAAWNIIFKAAKKNYLARCQKTASPKAASKTKRPDWLNI
ncbi:MAG: hypothetical protein R2800_04170 [Flavipsychrobacter sp.]